MKGNNDSVMDRSNYSMMTWVRVKVGTYEKGPSLMQNENNEF